MISGSKLTVWADLTSHRNTGEDKVALDWDVENEPKSSDGSYSASLYASSVRSMSSCVWL